MPDQSEPDQFLRHKPEPSCLYPYSERERRKSGYHCRCHERMGNDYWFLPERCCLFNEELKAKIRHHQESQR